MVLSLSIVTRLARPRSVELDVFQLDAEIFRDHLAAGEDRDVLQHGLAAIAEARGLHGRDVQGAAELVDHQGGQRFAFDFFSDDHERLAHLGNLLEDREEVLHAADFLFVDQDERLFQTASIRSALVTK